MGARKRARRTDDQIAGPAASPTVAVRVRPGSARAGVGGRADGPYGPALVVAVHAPAVGGRATEAARRAIAAALGVRPAAVALRAGASSRDKLFTVDAAAALLDARVRWLRDGDPDDSERGGARPGRTDRAGAEPGGAEPCGAEPGGNEPGGAEPGGAEPGGAEPGGNEPGGARAGGGDRRPGGRGPQGDRRR